MKRSPKLNSLSVVVLTLVCLTVAAPQPGFAVTITYDPLIGNANYSPIPAGYGSTADVAVSYRTLKPSDDSVLASDLLFWNAGYGDLPSAAFAHSNGLIAEITLTPLGGKTLTLNSFMLAGYPMVDKPSTTVHIDGAADNVLLDYSPVTVKGAGPSHSTFSPNLVFSSPIAIEWGTDWNVGINYINYSLGGRQAVPEPGTIWLLGAGALGLLGWKLRSMLN